MYKRQEYYLYNAVVGGEITTVKVAAGAFAGVGNDTSNYVRQEPDYNSKGVITGFAHGLTGYTEYNQYNGNGGCTGALSQGIWKLSGDYTIGIGGIKASNSIRLTVANNAEIFYVCLSLIHI